MRGSDAGHGKMFSYVSLERRVALDHPLRAIRAFVDECLTGLDERFADIYSRLGRPSIAPERLIRALLRAKPFTRCVRSVS